MSSDNKVRQDRFEIVIHSVRGTESYETGGSPLDAMREAYRLLDDSSEFYLLLDRRTGSIRRFNYTNGVVGEEV